MGMRLLSGPTLPTQGGRRALRSDGQERSMEWFRIAFGLGLGLLASNLVGSGDLTGGGEENPRRRNVRRIIRPPFSLLAGNRWHYISDLTEDLFFPIKILATVFEAIGWGTTSKPAGLDAERKGKLDSLVSKGLRVLCSIPDTVFNKWALSSPAQLYRYARDPNWNSRMLTEHMIRLVTPAGWGLLSRLRRRPCTTRSRRNTPRLGVFADPPGKSPVAQVPWLGTLYAHRRTPFPEEGRPWPWAGRQPVPWPERGRGRELVPPGRRPRVRAPEGADRHRAKPSRRGVREAAALHRRNPSRAPGSATGTARLRAGPSSWRSRRCCRRRRTGIRRPTRCGRAWSRRRWTRRPSRPGSSSAWRSWPGTSA